MRLPPDGWFIPRRGAGMPGQGYWKWVGDKLYFARSPRRQPTPRSAAEAFNRQAFQISTQVVKIMDAYQRDYSLTLSKQSQLAAQDFMYIALWGRIGTFVRKDGTKVFSMAAMQDVSKLLDAIWQLKGGILVRGDTWWEGLEPGDPGTIMTIGLDGSPSWQDFTPGTPGRPPQFYPNYLRPEAGSAINAGNFNALAFIPQEDVTVTGIRLWVTALPAARTLYAGLYENPSSATLTGATQRAASAAQAAALGPNEIPFSAPYLCRKNHVYWYGLANTGTGTSMQLAQSGVSLTGLALASVAIPLPATAGTAVTTGAQTILSHWLY